MTLFNFQFFKRTGFYFSLASVIALIAASLSYVNGFTDVLLEYNNSNVLYISLIGVVVFALMLVFEPTSNYAPLALWIVSFVSLLVYVNNIYMYFTGIFYNGISADAFALIDSIVMVSTILFVVSFVVANISMYMNHSATEED